MMDIAHRMTFSEVSALYPDAFWVFVYVAWGAAYGALTTSLVVSIVGSNRFTQNNPTAKVFLLFLKLIWGCCNLAGVFVFPILIGLADRAVLVSGKYTLFMIGTWALTSTITWYICRRGPGENCVEATGKAA